MKILILNKLNSKTICEDFNSYTIKLCSNKPPNNSTLGRVLDNILVLPNDTLAEFLEYAKLEEPSNNILDFRRIL